MRASRPIRPETSQHRAVRDAIWDALPGWKRFIVAIDGVDGAGKSSLARYLAWQLGMPAIETDTLRVEHCGEYKIRESDLRLVLTTRLDHDRPVIAEGLFIIRTLATLRLKPDYLVYVEQEDWEGGHCFREKLSAYNLEYRPNESARFVFRCPADESDEAEIP